MQLVYHDPDTVRHVVSGLITHLYGRDVPKASAAIGVADNDGSLLGGFVYHDFCPETGVIEISGASIDKRWLTRNVLYGLFEYPFLQLQCQLVIMKCRSDDMALSRMLKAYGFKAYPIPRIFGRLFDGIVYTLTVEDWKNNGFHRGFH